MYDSGSRATTIILNVAKKSGATRHKTLRGASISGCLHCGGRLKTRPDRPVYDHLQEDRIDGRRAVVCRRHEARRQRLISQADAGRLPEAFPASIRGGSAP